MATFFPKDTLFSIFPSEEGHSIIGTYTQGENTYHFHLITFVDLDSAKAFFQMGMDYCKIHQTLIPSAFIKAINNGVK
jgi:hypothetical protein